MFIPRNMYYRGLSEGQSKLVSELGKKIIGESRRNSPGTVHSRKLHASCFASTQADKLE